MNPQDADQLAAVVVASLDESGDADQLARRAARSRTQFFRVFRALIDETPSAMRRRLRLERAAWQLGRTKLPVTEIAFDAGYGSLEAFTRAFRRAFRISPSLYRRMGATYFHLPAPTSIHFCAPASGPEGGAMDLFDLFSGADSFHIRKLLEHSRKLTDALLTRLETADREFTRILSDVRNRNAWSDTFVDALCEPPETFSFGGTFAHIITFNTYQRLVALEALRRLGVKVATIGCPTEYEATLTPAR